jgi:hypothetical protein
VAPGKAGERPCRVSRASSIPGPKARSALVGLVCPSGPPGQGGKPGCPSAGRGSGSFGLPRTLRGLRPSPAGPSRSSRDCAARRPKPVRGSPREPDLPSRALADGGDRLAPTAPLLGFVCDALSPTGLSRVHSREPKPPSVRRVPPIGSRSIHVVPPHLDGFLRAEVAGLLHPAAGQGFVAFRTHRRPMPKPSEDDPEPGRSQWCSPRRGSHPPKSSLRRQPHRIAAAVASLPLPSRRSGPTIRLGDAPIRRSGPPRHRARGAFAPPKRRGTAAQDLRDRRRTEVRRGPGDRAPSRVGPPCAIAACRSRWDAGPSNHRGATRLRGLAPSTKFVAVRPPLPVTDARSFHGLCSPPRSLVRPLHPSRSEERPGATALARRRRPAVPGWTGIPPRVHRTPRPPGRNRGAREAGARRVCPEHES